MIKHMELEGLNTLMVTITKVNSLRKKHVAMESIIILMAQCMKGNG